MQNHYVDNGNRKNDLERISINLFSSHKEEKRESIQKISECLWEFNLENLAGNEKKYPNYYLVAQAIDLFTKNNQFLFEIRNEAGTVSLYEKITKRFSDIYSEQSLPDFFNLLHERSDQPTYLVNMLHLVGKEKLEEQIVLLRREGFGTNSEESLQEANKRLFTFIGLNYCHSLHSTKNQENKQKLKALIPQQLPTHVHYEALRWSPKWKLIDIYKEDFKWILVKPRTNLVIQQRVKRLFKLLHTLDPQKADWIFATTMKKKVVPYQGLRENLMKSPIVTFFLGHLRQNQPERLCYLATVDDDAVHLRTSNIGLFSHYDKLIASNPDLEIASTGYFMKHSTNIFVEVASRVNLAARQASSVMPSSVYFPEPNMLIKIPSEDSLSPKLSFIRQGEKSKAGNLESLAVLENLGLMGEASIGKVFFGQEGAIQTSISPNVKIPKKLLSNVTPRSFTDSKNLSSLRAFSQSTINPLEGFAKNVIRSFPDRTNKGVSRTHLAAIYTAFDPVEYSKYLKNNWLEAYEIIFRKIIEIYNFDNSSIVKDENYFRTLAEEITNHLKLPDSTFPTIIILIKAKVNALYGAREQLIKNKFNPNEIRQCIQLSINMNWNVFTYLKKVIETGDIQ